jgi:hypothetical protein
VANPRPKHLVVEDNDQKGAVIGLMRHNGVPWPPFEDDGWPVYIYVAGSTDGVLKKSTLSTRFKESGLQTLGIITDADDNFPARWNRVKSFCQEVFAAVPTDCPDGGLILTNGGKKFGAWIMPDNKSSGMIETFCRMLIPNKAAPIWGHATAAAGQARTLGAPFRDVHVEKAHVATWLAWQDPPGERMGTAITMKVLDPAALSAAAFVKWFKELYEV